MTAERYFSYTEQADQAIADAVSRISDRVDERARKKLPVNRDTVTKIAQEELKPVFATYIRDGVTDTEPRAAIGDALDAILERHGRPQESWRAYSLYS
jgi:hypothetical protein